MIVSKMSCPGGGARETFCPALVPGAGRNQDTNGDEPTMSNGTGGAQDWRAVACLAPSGERLLCVGESSSQVRAAYTGAWGEVIRDEDRPTVRAISLQRWTGQFWSGQWEHQMYLAVPTARSGKVGSGETVEEEEDSAETAPVKAKKK